MSKKQDEFYFNHFQKSAYCVLVAGQLLVKILNDYQADQIEEYLKQMHQIENKGDISKHELTDQLVKSFITPFDREDIMLLSQRIDDATDRIDDIVVALYTDCITTIRPEAVSVAEILTETCHSVQQLIQALPHFKHDRTFSQKIIHINNLEEKADKLFEQNMRNLHAKEKDPLQLIVWRDLYKDLERAVDACEILADTVDTVVLKNS